MLPWWRSLVRLVLRFRRVVSPDNMCALADRRDLDAVGHDLNDVVVPATKVGVDAEIKGCRVGIVQRDEIEIVFLDVQGEGSCVAGADDACALRRAAAAGP